MFCVVDLFLQQMKSIAEAVSFKIAFVIFYKESLQRKEKLRKFAS